MLTKQEKVVYTGKKVLCSSIATVSVLMRHHSIFRALPAEPQEKRSVFGIRGYALLVLPDAMFWYYFRGI